MNKEILIKSLPEYLPEFFKALAKQINSDNERWGNTWKERGLYWEGKSQELRFIQWVDNKYIEYLETGKMPWLKIAGEAFIGYIREKYLGERSEK